GAAATLEESAAQQDSLAASPRGPALPLVNAIPAETFLAGGIGSSEGPNAGAATAPANFAWSPALDGFGQAVAPEPAAAAMAGVAASVASPAATGDLIAPLPSGDFVT